MINFVEYRGEVKVQCIRANLMKVSWSLCVLVRQLSKAKNPDRSKSNARSHPLQSSLNEDEKFLKNALPLKGVVTWVTIFFLYIAFWHLVWHGGEIWP